MSNPRILGLICTDRGQHSRCVLGDLVGRAERIDVNRGFAMGDLAGRRKHECVRLDDERRVHIRCPRCSRNPQWTAEHARDVLDRLTEAGFVEFDVSYEPSTKTP